MKAILTVCLTLALLLCSVCTGVPVSEAVYDYSPLVNVALASYLNGDMDGDWTVSTSDARSYLLPVRELMSIDPLPTYMDYDGSGDLNTADARALLSDVINGVTPTVISPPTETVTTIPVGESMDFETAVSVDWWRGKTTEDSCYVVQSQEELQALYAADTPFEDYTAAFTADFFRENALVLVKVSAPELPREVYVHELVRTEDNALTVYLTELYDYDTTPITYNGRLLLTIAKEDLTGITSLRIYEEIIRDVLYELL